MRYHIFGLNVFKRHCTEFISETLLSFLAIYMCNQFYFRFNFGYEMIVYNVPNAIWKTLKMVVRHITWTKAVTNKKGRRFVRALISYGECRKKKTKWNLNYLVFLHDKIPTVPNNSYRFWADLLICRWPCLGDGMADIHKYWSKTTLYINQIFLG